jgi:hypothetical protein
MMAAFLLCVLCLDLTLKAGESLDVSVCNFAHVPDHTVLKAEEEVQYIFRSIGIELDLTSCDADRPTNGSYARSHLFVRIKDRSLRPEPEGGTSHAIMGLSYLDDRGEGTLADVYWEPVSLHAQQFGVADKSTVLGCAMAHELGHLLLGRGHSSMGLMKSVWGSRDFDYMKHRSLKFAGKEREAIGSRLSEIHGQSQERTLAADTDPGPAEGHGSPTLSTSSFQNAKGWGRTYVP